MQNINDIGTNDPDNFTINDDKEDDPEEDYLPEEEDYLREEEDLNEETEQEEEVVVVAKKKQKPKGNIIKPVRKVITIDRKKPMGSVEVLCSDFVKLSNSLKSSIKKRAIFRKVLFTVLKDKCADHRLNRTVEEKMISLLRSDQDSQEINYKQEKLKLFKQYFDFQFSVSQSKVIADLAEMEVTQENIEQQLVFATYYAKIAKLMLKYNLASTDRSREAVNDVIESLNNMSYGASGFVTPVSWLETMFMRPKDMFYFILIIISCSGLWYYWAYVYQVIIAVLTFKSLLFYCFISGCIVFIVVLYLSYKNGLFDYVSANIM